MIDDEFPNLNTAAFGSDKFHPESAVLDGVCAVMLPMQMY